MLVPFAAAAKILAVEDGTSFYPTCLPGWPTCHVLSMLLALTLVEMDFCEQSTFLRYLCPCLKGTAYYCSANWGKPDAIFCHQVAA
jgi:hypothetical protein